MTLRTAAVFALAAFAAAASEPPSSFSSLQKLFADPPAAYRTVPFFVWNGEVTEAEIDAHLADFKAAGAGGVFIHPRPGMITPYLDNRWFELCRYAVEQGKKLGLEVWLYDENSYPSGFAGGHVPAEMPESWNEGQGLVLRRMAELRLDPAKKYPVVLRRTSGGFAEVDPAAESGRAGDYYAFELAFYEKTPWYGGFSYVDLIRPGVTGKFIEVTMRGYERTIGAEFGRTVPGVFTDEPHIRPPVGKNGIRWTPDLFEQFSARWGYDLKPLLPCLLEETGDWRRVRHNYYQLLLELFIDRWSKPWYRYAESKNLKWTGHYWEHEWPNPANGPDNMAMYAWHHVPSIDMLFNQFDEGVNAQFGNVRSVKELASVANQLGRGRTLSETYGGAGWELRFEDMKRLGDWEYALGVNLMNQHLSYQTIAGARKHDYPQSFSYHEPWWKHYGTLGDYFGRLSLALSSGEQVNRILVIEPSSSAWMYAASHPRMREIGSAFQAFVTRLESMQVEYDLGSENIISDRGRVDGPRFAVGRRAYDLVILPPGLENLNSPTVELLAGYLRNGGRVLAFCDAPVRVDGEQSDTVAELAAQNDERWIRAAAPGDAAAAPLLASDFIAVTGKLFHHRRKLSDGDLLFIVNSSLEAPASASLKLPGGAMKLNALTGAVEPFDASRIELAPGGSLLIYTSPRLAHASHEAPSPAFAPVDGGPLEVRRAGPNVLTLDYCDLTLGGATERGLYYYFAQEKVFKHFGFAGNPWNTAVQYKTSILDRNHFAPDSGFSAAFRFEIAPGTPRAGLRAVIERPSLWMVAVNGHTVSARPGEWWLDRAFGVYDIGEYAVEGANDITLTARPMSIHNEVEPVYILGDFAMESHAAGWRLTPPHTLATGAWKEQGLPFYSHEVSYARTYELEKGDCARVRLGQWGGTVAEVRVNGKPAGLIAWQPYELDISRFVVPGKNRVEVLVCGSLKNLLGPHHGKINRGLVSPWSFRTAPEQPPPGASYDLDAYGLFDGFTLVRAAGR
mgnify:CR=1 FL=1